MSRTWKIVLAVIAVLVVIVVLSEPSPPGIERSPV